MKKATILTASALCMLFASNAWAGECVLNITRTACPGQEAESFKKCNGKPACEEVKETGSAEACAKEAEKACENSRLNITKSKTITAEFEGKAVENGKNLCDPNRPDFNKC